MKFQLPQIQEVKPEIVGFVNRGMAYLTKPRMDMPQWSTNLQQGASKLGSKLGEGFVSSGKSFVNKTMEVMNPGTSYISPQLEKRGVNPAIAGGIGLGIDILAPGPGELSKGAKVGKNIAEDVLAKEARKYKTAEEFVKNQPKLYTGKVGDIELDFNRVAQKGNQLPYGVHFTNDEGIAKSFASGVTKGMPTGSRGIVEEVVLNAKKPFDVSKGANNGKFLFEKGTEQAKVLEEIAKKSKISGNLYQPYSKSVGSFVSREQLNNYNDIQWMLEPEWVLDKAKPATIKSILEKNGYDPVIKYNMRGTEDILGMGTPIFTDAWAVLDKNFIKTKSQLTDIFNKAHGK